MKKTLEKLHETCISLWRYLSAIYISVFTLTYNTVCDYKPAVLTQGTKGSIRFSSCVVLSNHVVSYGTSADPVMYVKSKLCTLMSAIKNVASVKQFEGDWNG